MQVIRQFNSFLCMDAFSALSSTSEELTYIDRPNQDKLFKNTTGVNPTKL
jgi:hypothetical protein